MVARITRRVERDRRTHAMGASSGASGRQQGGVGSEAAHARVRCRASLHMTRRHIGTVGETPVAIDPQEASLIVAFSTRRRHTRSLCDWSSDVCFFFFKQKTAYEITV